MRRSVRVALMILGVFSILARQSNAESETKSFTQGGISFVLPNATSVLTSIFEFEHAGAQLRQYDYLAETESGFKISVEIISGNGNPEARRRAIQRLRQSPKTAVVDRDAKVSLDLIISETNADAILSQMLKAFEGDPSVSKTLHHERMLHLGKPTLSFTAEINTRIPNKSGPPPEAMEEPNIPQWLTSYVSIHVIEDKLLVTTVTYEAKSLTQAQKKEYAEFWNSIKY